MPSKLIKSEEDLVKLRKPMYRYVSSNYDIKKKKLLRNLNQTPHLHSKSNIASYSQSIVPNTSPLWVANNISNIARNWPDRFICRVNRPGSKPAGWVVLHGRRSLR